MTLAFLLTFLSGAFAGVATLLLIQQRQAVWKEFKRIRRSRARAWAAYLRERNQLKLPIKDTNEKT